MNVNNRKWKIKSLIHSVAGKNACQMLLCGLAMLFFALFLPSLFYRLMKEQLTDQIGNSIQESSVRIGFLLTNHRISKQLAESTEFLGLLETYYQEDTNQERLYKEITKKLAAYEEGKMEWDRGSIGNTSYYFALTDQGDLFCPEEVRKLARDVVSSDWFTQDVSVLTGEEHVSGYSPVLTFDMEGMEEAYLCFFTSFTAGERFGWLVHVALFQDYIDQMQRMEQAGIQDYMLVCREEVLYHSLPQPEAEHTGLSNYHYGDYQYGVLKRERENGYDFTVLCSLNREGVYMIIRMNRDEIIAPFLAFFRVMQICVIVIILLMVGLSCGVVFFSLRRLTALGREMALIGKGATKLTIQDDHHDEIGDIVRTTHMMLDQLQQSTEERIAHEKEEKHMQYTLMISAMDPHFIYNTLDTVSFLAAMGRDDDVVKMNDALIATLKDRLKMKAYKTFDSVQVELDVIQNYMVIQSYLCSDKITCEYEVEEETRHLLIPKNILQPLVENSIKHGLMTNKDDIGLEIREGKVVVGVHRKGERLEIIVSDNGSGMPEELKEHYLKEEFVRDGSAEHIGLLNMKGRLAYLYHGDFNIDIESMPGQGTTIRIIVPASIRATSNSADS